MSTLKRAYSRSRNLFANRPVLFFLVALVYVIPFLTVTGMASIYLKLGNLKGDSTDTGHIGWIKIDSMQMGVGRGISSATGGTTREASTPSFSEVVITKSADSTTPQLFSRAVGTAGGTGEPAVIDFTRDTANGPVVYYQVGLSNVLVSGFSQSSGGDNPSESLSLNFTKIGITYTPLDAKGTPMTPISAGYDLTTGK